MTKSDCFERANADYPLSSEELRRWKGKAATTVVPKDFDHLSAVGQPTARKIKFVERLSADEKSKNLVQKPSTGHCPSWVSASAKPKRARFAPPHQVKHRGQQLDPHIIWGDEDRRTYNDLTYPWGCVCRITNAAGKVGSGSIIGPRHILTASHVIDWSTDRPEKIEVHLTGNVAAATVFDTVVYAFTQIQGDPTYTTLDEDYAVMVVNERLGDRFGWLGAKVYNSDWDDDNIWETMGYPTDIAGGTFPIFEMDKNLDEDEFDYGSGRAMTTSADMMKGQSGSPMFSMWPDGIAYAVAVMSSYGQVFASGNENWCSGGSDLNRIIRIARDENP
jgi:V8-like Glu-specific endopeptidase